ncbi:MAG: N-acetyltransferase [Cellvibrionaceae bacterium]|nr:N-acetyltransferase [Cellvibrionaceae bacterium]MCV6624727.1 N-acetyltransferase [Cellvibrionaceae bacterium]
MSEKFLIEQQLDSCRFIIPGTEAVLEYQLDSKGDSVDFSRTYVPDAMRGSGAAQALVGAGLRWARGQELKIEASCWYVEKFLGKP